jgi:hypothetical protein
LGKLSRRVVIRFVREYLLDTRQYGRYVFNIGQQRHPIRLALYVDRQQQQPTAGSNELDTHRKRVTCTCGQRDRFLNQFRFGDGTPSATILGIQVAGSDFDCEWLSPEGSQPDFELKWFATGVVQRESDLIRTLSRIPGRVELYRKWCRLRSKRRQPIESPFVAVIPLAPASSARMSVAMNDLIGGRESFLFSYAPPQGKPPYFHVGSCDPQLHRRQAILSRQQGERDWVVWPSVGTGKTGVRCGSATLAS